MRFEAVPVGARTSVRDTFTGWEGRYLYRSDAEDVAGDLNRQWADAAARYAARVHQVLLDEFPRLADPAVARVVTEAIARHAELADDTFEVHVDDLAVANWALYPDHTDGERWRVRLACRKHRPSSAQNRREQRINDQLRAINLEES